MFFIIISIIFYCKIKQKLEKNKKLEKYYVEFSLLGVEYLEDKRMAKNTPIILSLFHPSCHFCKVDAEQFHKKHASLKNFEVLWLSYDEKDSIQKFAKVHGLDTFSNVHFAHIDIETMIEHYGNVKFPTFLTYDAKEKLIAKFVGLTKLEVILTSYNESRNHAGKK